MISIKMRNNLLLEAYLLDITDMNLLPVEHEYMSIKPISIKAAGIAVVEQ